MDETRENDFDIVPNSNPGQFPDLLPEFCDYHDEGCELFEACLECPFPYCVLEEKGAKTRQLKRVRDSQMTLKNKGGRNGVEKISTMFGVSLRTARRVLHQRRNKSKVQRRHGRKR